jgi:HJR/Mrr/RecB family endonuclease
MITPFGPGDEPARSKHIQERIDLALSALRAPRTPPSVLRDVVENTDRLTPELIEHLKTNADDLRKISWNVFEHLIGEFLAHQGFRDVRLVGRDPRTSADLYATWVIDSAGLVIRFFIEVKRWKERVGIGVINEVLGAMFSEREAFGWHASLIVASGGFTDLRKHSQLEVSLRGVDLKGKQDLLRWLKEYRPNKNGLWLPAPERTMPVAANLSPRRS